MIEKKHLGAILGILAMAFVVTGCQPKPEPAAMEESSETMVKEEKSDAMMKESTATQESEAITPSDETAMAKTAQTVAKYTSPAGAEEVKFEVEVDEDGLVTDVRTTVMAEAPISKLRQQAFADGVNEVVVGKKLDELTKIDIVGGSSLTTGAFNKALEELKKQV